MIYNSYVDPVNDNVYTKFGLILFIHSQDIERKPNYMYVGMTERERERERERENDRGNDRKTDGVNPFKVG